MMDSGVLLQNAAADDPPSVSLRTNSSTLEFEVVPQQSLQNEHIDFLIGMPINQVIVALQNNARLIKNVELRYCNRDPFERDITVTIKNEGIRLYFEPKYQLLKLIEVFDFSAISLHYCNNVFSSPQEPANVNSVENCFGATHPGVYDEKQKMYILNWQGVSFCFPAKERLAAVQPSYAHGLGSLSFVNSSLPMLERMTIFPNGSASKEITPDDIPISAYCGNIIGQEIVSIANADHTIEGLLITYRAETPVDLANVPTRDRKAELQRCERTIRFGDSEGSVLSALGAPSKIYYKSDLEKMLIQRSGSDSESLKNGEEQPDFFYNYFTLGLDILFDFQTRRVQKFVLHTNVPGHFDFAIYHRANFTINVRRDGQEYAICTNSKLEEFQSLFSPLSNFEEEGSGAEKDLTTNNRDCGMKPVILNKCTSATEGEPKENPFGSSFCYGTEQIIVELMDNSHIASVVLYQCHT